METLLVQLVGNSRRATLHGREYLVCPLVLIVPGVLNGSQGPLYYSPEETGRDPQAWNGMPMVVYHPTVNGVAVTARSPEVLAQSWVGYVFNAKFDGKLTAEGWFEIEATRRVDMRVYEAVVNNKPIGLSTGLFTRNELAENGAAFNGTPYTHHAKDHRPDHLAILPDQKGACSLTDGCGVNVNARTLETNMEKAALVTWLVTNCDCWKGEGDKAVLEGMSQEKLTKLKTNAEQATQLVANNQKLQEDLKKAQNPPVAPPATTITSTTTAPDKPTDNGPPTKSAIDESQLPPQMRATLNEARKIVENRKVEILGRLVDLMDEDKKEMAFNQFKGKSVEEIEAFLALLPKTTFNRTGTTVDQMDFASFTSRKRPTQNHDEFDFIGAAGVAPTSNFLKEEDGVPLPVDNFGEDPEAPVVNGVMKKKKRFAEMN